MDNINLLIPMPEIAGPFTVAFVIIAAAVYTILLCSFKSSHTQRLAFVKSKVSDIESKIHDLEQEFSIP